MNKVKSIIKLDPDVAECLRGGMAQYDDREMVMVKSWKGFKVGMRVSYIDSNETYERHHSGKILAIGKKAKFRNGEYFVAFVISHTATNGVFLNFATNYYVHHVV